ncbi:MAG: thioredoxin family protein [Myxococcota bacterium]
MQMNRTYRGVVCAVAVLVVVGCRHDAQATRQVDAMDKGVLVGLVSPEQILDAAGWQAAMAEIAVAEEPAPVREKLIEVELVVVLGTWCPDSVREVTRFWGWAGGLVHDELRVSYIAVDRNKRAPELQSRGLTVQAVPTFVVYRDGREQGRVVERAVEGIGSDLLRLIDGQASGTISATR